MTDLFLHLAAQSLSSNVGVQPLITPLFAPTPQLVAQTNLPVFHDQPAVATETAPFSIAPATFAGRMTDLPEMEQPFEEAALPEKRAILSDLVPPEVPRDSAPTLSLRHLLQPQHPAYDEMESLLPVTQSLVPAPAGEEPVPEDVRPPTLAQDQSGQRSGNTREERAPVLPLPVQAQEGILPETTETPSSIISDGGQKQAQAYSFRASSTKREVSSPQHTAPPADTHVEPLSMPPVTLASLPSPQPLIQSELSVRRDEATEEYFLLLMQSTGMAEAQPEPHTQGYQHSGEPARQLPVAASETIIKPLLDQPALGRESQSPFSHPAVPASVAQPPTMPVAVVAERVITPLMPFAGQEMAGEIVEQDAHQRKMAVGWQEEKVSTKQASGQRVPQDAPYSARVSPKSEAAIAKEEEVSPIRITIGRVVVRATPAAQAAPIQKRVLRPAQSLSEYLKQREKGRR